MTPVRNADQPLVLSSELRDQVAQLARQAYPREACGLLVGRRGSAAVVVENVARARNLSGDADRYELAPEDWCSTWRDAELQQAEIVGVWHSHPDHGAVPSRSDNAVAWDDYSYLIAAVSPSGVSELRCWRLDQASFSEQSVVTDLEP